MNKFLQVVSIAFFVIISGRVACQTAQSKIYLDRYCKTTNEVTEAVYYRTIERKGIEYEVKDYYIANDSLEMKALCKEVEPKLIYEGEAIWFFENGNVRKVGSFKDGDEIGMFNYYYQNGSRQKEILYSKDKMLVCQYWTEDGSPLLINGSGIVNRKDSDIYNADYYEVIDSVIETSFSIRPDKGDSIYIRANEAASYKGGMTKFYEGVAKNLVGKYPKDARRLGVQGRVFIEFIVDKKGVLTEPKVLKGIGSGCDEAAINAFIPLKNNWIPAQHNGKPVKSKMVLPVVFKIN